MNPQICIDVEDPDETDNDPTGTVVIGLMQMGMREKKQQPHTIGYAIYKASSRPGVCISDISACRYCFKVETIYQL